MIKRFLNSNDFVVNGMIIRLSFGGKKGKLPMEEPLVNDQVSTVKNIKIDPNRLIQKLIDDNPALHEYKGQRTSWAVDPDTLWTIFNMLEPGMKTLETGCGQTTIVFMVAGTHHVCITDDNREVVNVNRYCEEVGIENTLTFLTGSSDKVLPCNIIHDHLDFVFLDGAHRFPFPIVDWHYTSERLKVGGVIALDDYQIPSVEILYNFLSTDDNWDLIQVKNNTAFFKKIKEPLILDDWQGQSINLKYIENKNAVTKNNQINSTKISKKINKLINWLR